MIRDRLNLAFDLIRPTEWERFESFCTEFLTVDYPNLRTVGGPSGDEGRDAILWQTDARPSVVLQFSIARDYQGKIKKSCRRIAADLGGTRGLVFLTNQKI